MLRDETVTRQKQFQKGLEQLEEGRRMKGLTLHEGLKSEPILEVVGELAVSTSSARG